HQLPPEGGWRLDTAKMAGGAFFWGLALALVVYSVGQKWHPVAIGLAAGGIVLARLAVDIYLHHRFGGRGAPRPWRELADAGHKREAVRAFRRETGVGPAEAKAAVEAYLATRAEDQV